MRKLSYLFGYYMRLGIVVAAMILSLLISNALAAVSFFFEAENGTLTGQAQAIGDSSASGNFALQFAGSGGVINLPNPGTWTNVTSNLASLPSAFGVHWVSAVPNTDKVIAGIAEISGMWQTTNGGTSWTALGTGSGSAVVDNRPWSIVYDPLNPNIFWVAGFWGDFNRGIFKTTNGGQTFQALGNVGHVDSISVDFSDPNRQTLLAGGHESRRIHKSTNGGQTWTNIENTLPADTNFTTHPYVINSQTYVVNSMNSGNNGVFRTTNGGASWTRVYAGDAPSHHLLKLTNGTMLWSAGDGLIRSTDNGQTWTRIASGLRGEFGPIQLPDSRVVSSNGQRLLVSADNGSTWTQFGPQIPLSFTAGVTYNSVRNAFYIWTYTGGDRDPNAVFRLQ